MDEKINILIADDQELYREGLSALLKYSPFIETIFEANNGLEAIDLIRNNNVSVVLMDLRMPVLDGYETIKIIRKQFPSIIILVLSMVFEPYFIDKVDSIGADGYLTKDCNFEEISGAILKTLEGGPRPYLSKAALEILKNESTFKSSLWPHPKDKLNEKEVMVLRYICESLTAKEIGNKMHVSEKDIEYYKKQLFSKTGTKGIIQLVVFAIINHYFKI